MKGTARFLVLGNDLYFPDLFFLYISCNLYFSISNILPLHNSWKIWIYINPFIEEWNKIYSKLFYDWYIFVLDLVVTDACSSSYRKWEFLDAIWITKLVKSINIWEAPLFSILWCISMIMKIFCKSYQTKEIVIVT